MAKKWICTVCGYIHEGDEAPEQCPMCKVGKDKFKQAEENAGALEFVTEHKIGDGKVDNAELMEGLNNHFIGECTEVGMYLAMSRQADRRASGRLRMGYEDQLGEAQERRVRRMRGQDASGAYSQAEQLRRYPRHGTRNGQGRGASRQGIRGAVQPLLQIIHEAEAAPSRMTMGCLTNLRQPFLFALLYEILRR